MADCGEDWGGYDPNECNTFTSGMDAAIALNLGIMPTDILNDGLTDIDITKLTALIGAGDAKILTGLMIGLDAPTPLQAPTYVACQPEQTTVDYDRTGTWKDPKVTNTNILFYNSINVASKKLLGGLLIRECKAERLTYIDAVVRMSGGRVSPEGVDTQRFEYTFAWRQSGDSITVPDSDAIWALQPQS